MKDWVRYFLPGVFSEVAHWRERALRAEARLGDVIGQFATTITHEKEQHDAERRELMTLLVGNTSQKPPLPEEEGGGNGNFPPSFNQNTHPIQRKIQEFYQQQANSIPDEVVEMATEEYLKLKAQGADPFDMIH